MLALMGRTANSLQVPWATAAEPRWSMFKTQATAPRPQSCSAFRDFMEDVRSSWDRPASAPSMLKQVAPLASFEGADKLDLAGFPPVDSTICGLDQGSTGGGVPKEPACPNLQCRVTETHLKRAYTAEAQACCSKEPGGGSQTAMAVTGVGPRCGKD
ncbi:UNVERIFIED_CONTAM: hypothetical protein FKN15_058356 [Acipenser sinensis]